MIHAICSQPDCTKQAARKELCYTHYSRLVRRGSPDILLRPWRMPVGMRCSIEECTRPVLARGFCNTHYGRWRRGADLAFAIKPKHAMRGVPFEERFWSRVNKTDTCWLWTGAIDSDGYGVFENEKAHRIADRLLTGAKRPSLETADHLCPNKNCVKPAHIEFVPIAENLHRRHQRAKHL